MSRVRMPLHGGREEEYPVTHRIIARDNCACGRKVVEFLGHLVRIKCIPGSIVSLPEVALGASGTRPCLIA